MGASCQPGAPGEVAPNPAPGPPKFKIGDSVQVLHALGADYGPIVITGMMVGPVCLKGCCMGFLYISEGTDKHPKVMAGETCLELWGP